MSDRIKSDIFRRKVMSAEDAAALIRPDSNVGMSGFTGAGYPKAVPEALADRIKDCTERGEEFRIGVWTGASTAPELDGALAAADGVQMRLPYQSDPITRKKINDGTMDYVDMHLSHVAQQVWQGFLGEMKTAVIEVTGITEDGELIPASSIGNNKSWLDIADEVILEVNEWQSADLRGMHDIYYGTALPPNRKPLNILNPGDRIGQETFRVDPAKVIAVVETNEADRNTPFRAIDDDSKRIAENLLDFLHNEVYQARIPKSLLPLQSGVGNIANAVLSGLQETPFESFTSFTEVIQDGMVDLLDSGKLTVASATAFSLSPEYAERMNNEARKYRERIVLRSQEISNHPEIIRRLGVISCNGMIEADIYGNINSTHIMGSRIQNGIGGSGDFTRNAYISTFVSPSTAKDGAISTIVPFVSHVDHTEHEVAVIITEQGLADLRGLSPRKRAQAVIRNCAHPDYREELLDYVARAERKANGMQTPHDLATAFSWHQSFLEKGTMKQA